MENLVLQSDVPSECERSRRPGDEGLRQWVRTEHHRLHCVEGWPDSPYKEAVLAAPVLLSHSGQPSRTRYSRELDASD